MDDIRFPTRKHQFPQGASEMLKIIEKVSRQSSKSSLNLRFLRDLQTMVDEHLFCLIESKGTFATKLSPIQELQLIDMLCTAFDERKTTTTRSSTSDGGVGASMMFELIFCGQDLEPALHEARCAILAKTVSLGAQLRCASLLNDAAAWMQKICLSPNTFRALIASTAIQIPSGVKKVCCQLIEDYCNFGPQSVDEASFLNTGALHQHRRLQQQRVVSDLATLSPNLIAYVFASAVSVYDLFACPPSPLFEILVDWICSNAKLLLKPYKDANKLTGNSTPLFLRSLSQAFGKLFCLCFIHAASGNNESNLLLQTQYGRLQLGLLQLMETASKFIPLSSSLNTADTPCAIITAKMAADTLKYLQQQKRENMQNACYALFQALQMAVACKCYSGTKRDLEQALAPYLNDYPFLEFVFNQQFW